VSNYFIVEALEDQLVLEIMTFERGACVATHDNPATPWLPDCSNEVVAILALGCHPGFEGTVCQSTVEAIRAVERLPCRHCKKTIRDCWLLVMLP
jgi:hypothetical protein